MTKLKGEFEYIKRAYGVEPKIGQRVIMNGKAGTIKKDLGHRIGVQFEGNKHVSACHPTWEFVYLDDEVPNEKG